MSKAMNKYVYVFFKKLFFLHGLYKYYFLHFMAQNASLKTINHYYVEMHSKSLYGIPSSSEEKAASCLSYFIQ